jgi:hypothetical protein
MLAVARSPAPTPVAATRRPGPTNASGLNRADRVGSAGVESILRISLSGSIDERRQYYRIRDQKTPKIPMNPITT